ncbi:MAG: RNA-binding protein [archaeon]|nr:RNA-binding protein [archaeon]
MSDDQKRKAKRARVSSKHVDSEEQARLPDLRPVDESACSSSIPSSSSSSSSATLPPSKRIVFDKSGIATAAEPVPAPVPRQSKSRFILFIGNIPHAATEPQLRTFFKSCGTISAIRLRKGYCFLELADSYSVQKALTYHHSLLDGRKINVLLSAGGGGNSEARRKKIEEKNKVLEEERKTKARAKREREQSGGYGDQDHPPPPPQPRQPQSLLWNKPSAAQEPTPPSAPKPPAPKPAGPRKSTRGW